MNDMGDWTRAAPDLYPHQWSWDSAFIAIGLAHLDTRRAAELLALFPTSGGPARSPTSSSTRRLRRRATSRDRSTGPAPRPLPTPRPRRPTPAAFASLRSTPSPPACLGGGPEKRGEEAEDARAFLHEAYPSLLRWHRYLLTYRDPEGSGLVTIYHPWESGTDNSPRWDAALAAVEVGDMPPYPRYDLQHVAKPFPEAHRRGLRSLPVAGEADKEGGCDERSIYRSHPFLVKDAPSVRSWWRPTKRCWRSPN